MTPPRPEPQPQDVRAGAGGDIPTQPPGAGVQVGLERPSRQGLPKVITLSAAGPGGPSPALQARGSGSGPRRRGRRPGSRGGRSGRASPRGESSPTPEAERPHRGLRALKLANEKPGREGRALPLGERGGDCGLNWR